MTGYFDIKRDMGFPYFCEGCLIGKTEEEMSKRDIRYCVECQPFIEAEYKIRGEKHGRYIPIPAEMPQDISTPQNDAPMRKVAEKEKEKMSTLNPPSLTVDKFRPRGRPKAYNKRLLPDEKIKQLHKGGMGPKAIATLLKREQGIDVSYKTIQRVLSGERN